MKEKNTTLHVVLQVIETLVGTGAVVLVAAMILDYSLAYGLQVWAGAFAVSLMLQSLTKWMEW